jgi:hypothetical protein
VLGGGNDLIFFSVSLLPGPLSSFISFELHNSLTMTAPPPQVGDAPSAVGSSINLGIDIEKREVDASNSPPTEYQRPISNGRWFLVCLGLYLAALLYGVSQ